MRIHSKRTILARIHNNTLHDIVVEGTVYDIIGTLSIELSKYHCTLTGRELAKLLDKYKITNASDNRFTIGNRGVFCTIRGAYNHFANKKTTEGSRIAKCIATAFTNDKGDYAYAY